MSLPAVRCLIAAAPGRSPFAGHVRGVDESGGVRLAWAGRIATSSSPEEAWEAADCLRDVMVEVRGVDRASVLAAVGPALGRLPRVWRDRGDLSLLLAAADSGGVGIGGFGFQHVLVETGGAWAAAALPGSPLLSDPGLPTDWPVAQPPLRTGLRFLGLCAGIPLPDQLDAACGIRR